MVRAAGRLLLLLFVTGVAVRGAWPRLGRWLPAQSHPARHPALTWSVALPIWIALAAMSLWFAPAAAYLWIVPLFSAGILLSITPPGNDPLIRVASIVVLCVSGTMWLREATELSRFIVALMGRLPIVTPFFVYAAVLSAAGLTVAPPFIAVVATERPLPRPGRSPRPSSWPLAATFGAAYAAPAYTQEQPLRRYVRALQDETAQRELEVASVEPGLDLAPDAPGEWTPTDGGAASTDIPWGRYSFPFVFRAEDVPGPPRQPWVVRDQAVDRRQPAVDLRDPARAGLARHLRAACGNHAGAQQPAGRRAPRPLDGDVRGHSRGRDRLGSEPADPAVVSQ